MAHDRIALLIRAVTRLRVQGSSDAELIDALARLILPEPRGATAEASAPTILRPSAPQVPRVEPERAALRPPVRPPVVVRPQSEDAGTTARRRTSSLKGVPSVLEQVIDRADLDVPQSAVIQDRRMSDRSPSEAQPVAPLESLFASGRVRAIIRELATRTTHTGPVDVAAAVRRIARGDAIDRVPRRPLSSLGHTVQLLFDAGPLMVPFARDKQQLVATATRVLGRDRLRVADFIGTPLQGVRAQRQVRWEGLRWPDRRSAVVVVSDLGTGGERAETDHRAAEWLRFLHDAHARGLRTFALIPYPADRWPQMAAAFSTSLTWDVETGMQALRQQRERR